MVGSVSRLRDQASRIARQLAEYIESRVSVLRTKRCWRRRADISPSSTGPPAAPAVSATRPDAQGRTLMRFLDMDLLQIRAAKGAALVAQQIAFAHVARHRRISKP